MSSRFDEKHTAIVEVAIQSFLDNGFAGTSMDGVARLAGISKATLYNHFADKSALFEEVMTVHCQSLNSSALLKVFSSHEPIEEQFKQFAQLLVRALREPRSIALMRVVIFETGQFAELGKAIWKDGKLPLLNDFADVLKQKHEEKVLNVVNPLIAARQFFGLVKESLVWPMLMGLEIDASESYTQLVINDAVDIFLNYYQHD